MVPVSPHNPVDLEEVDKLKNALSVTLARCCALSLHSHVSSTYNTIFCSLDCTFVARLGPFLDSKVKATSFR
jgi:hypothetical protein